jgi:predicted site-specific integrase-resolvase
LIPDTLNAEQLVIGYARVSCADQKEDLPRQVDKLKGYTARSVG